MSQLAQSWLRVLDQVDKRHSDRVRRGRALASGGKVSELQLTPGLIVAEVQDGGLRRATVRVRCFEDETWRAVAELIAKEVRVAVHLVAGTLAPSLAMQLRTVGAELVPAPADVESDCDCGDFAVPCAHAAAAIHLVAEVIEGDPWSLCTLRGRMPEQLLADLRRVWGDAQIAANPHRAPLEAPPSGDPFLAPRPLEAMLITLHGVHGTGALELGPLPGDQDLQKALAPLYDAGVEAAVRLATAEGGASDASRRLNSWLARDVAPPEPSEEDDVYFLSERIVDRLAEDDDGMTTKQLARALDLDPLGLEAELLELEAMGILVRSGGARAPRWWLG